MKTLRNILGTKTLAEMLSERDAMSALIQKILDDGTDPWGVKVSSVLLCLCLCLA